MGEIEIPAFETEESSEGSRDRHLVSQALRERSDQSIEERRISRREALETNKKPEEQKGAT